MTSTALGTQLKNNHAVISQTEETISSTFNILQLRQAQALQRYRKIVNTGNQAYKTQIEKIYGINLPSYMNHTATYLGGFTSNINIKEVVNNNLADAKSSATIQGKGIGQYSNNRHIDFDVKEHGIIMCIYHVLPILDYKLDAYHFDVVKTEVDDFANPVFDKLGYQELPSYFLDATKGSSKEVTTLGYVPRYFDYKTSLDKALFVPLYLTGLLLLVLISLVSILILMDLMQLNTSLNVILTL